MSAERFISRCRRSAAFVILFVIGSCATKSDSQMSAYLELESLLPRIVDSDKLRPEDVAYLKERGRFVIYLFESESEIHGLISEFEGEHRIIDRSEERDAIEQWVREEKSYIRIREISPETYSVQINGSSYMLERKGLRRGVSHFGI
jgi:hypothetical protein